MRRRRLLVPLLLALSGLGWAGAHAVAHDLAGPPRTQSAAAGMEGYATYLPVSFALCFGLALALAAGAVLGRRRRPSSGTSLWLFGAVPVIGYVGHAVSGPLLEGSGGLSHAAAFAAHVAPLALVALLVQLPFALVAVALGARVLGLAESVARWLAGPRASLGRRLRGLAPPPHALLAPAVRLEPARSQRGPPR